jgi:two-component system, OmpR family, response regulator TctD
MRLLLVEDNRPLSTWLQRTLQRDKYSVDCAYDGIEADHLLLTQSYDLVILDLSLPRMEGYEVLKRLRARAHGVPVLILTANNSTRSRIDGFNLGADDYMAKPFEADELEARIRALLRRAAKQPSPMIQCGMLSYDSNSRLFTLGAEALSLTPREHAVLEALMLKMGAAISKQALASAVFALEEDVSENAIEIYVHRLRKKLEHGNATIITLRGLGYLLKQKDAL